MRKVAHGEYEEHMLHNHMRVEARPVFWARTSPCAGGSVKWVAQVADLRLNRQLRQHDRARPRLTAKQAGACGPTDGNEGGAAPQALDACASLLVARLALGRHLQDRQQGWR